MQRIKQNVLEVDPQAEVWLYGSRARGTASSDSDWDVLVLTMQPYITTVDEGRFIDHMCDLIVESGQVIQSLFKFQFDSLLSMIFEKAIWIMASEDSE